jgi:hypothetical protein
VGQADIINFFEKNSKGKFTKEDIEKATRKPIKNYSLNSLVDHGEIHREAEYLNGSNNGPKRYWYSYLHNSSSKIANFRK